MNQEEKERWLNIKNDIVSFVLTDFTIEDIENVEENCGSLFIDLKDGKTYYVQIVEVEKIDEDHN